MPSRPLGFAVAWGAVSCSRGLLARVLWYGRPCSNVPPYVSTPFVSPGDLTSALEKKKASISEDSVLTEYDAGLNVIGDVISQNRGWSYTNLGDINGDGQLNVVDIVQLVNIIIG